jgi:hypothetical protein
LLGPKILFFSNLIERESYIEKKCQLIHLGRYSKRIIDLAGSISLKELMPFLP